MISPGSVIASILPVYLLILAGAALRKANILHREHDNGVMRVIYNVMLPCYILDKVLGSQDLRSSSMLMWCMVIGFINVVVGTSIAWFTGRLLGLEKGTGARTFALAAGCQNYGFTAVPVIEILWGASTLGVLFIHNLGVEMAMWSVGVMILTGEKGVPWKKLINGPVIAITIGLILVVLHLDDQVTGPLRKAISLIGVGAFPLTILITGCTMMDLAVAERPSLKILAGCSLVRFILCPAVILIAAKYLPLQDSLKKILIVQAAMPAGMTAIMLARMYGGRPAIAVQIVIATTVLSVFTLPWIITWGCQWIKLTPILP